ncbi:MAG: signal peptidase I [Lachnospiraceae bacterium]|nr:signal peptidase I [Lachnospiraceae bacterium]
MRKDTEVVEAADEAEDAAKNKKAKNDRQKQKKKQQEWEEQQEEEFSLKKEIVSWLYTISAAVIIAFLINHFIIVNANVPTGSMENTIMPGNRVVGFRLAYLGDGPKRGDIIMFRYPVDESEIFIKRVIGLPGETISIEKGKVYIDGSDTPLKEEYLKEDWIVANDGLTLQIPEDCYFCMGDNRNSSADSRYWAGEAVAAGKAASYEDAVKQKYCYVQRKKILGKAIFRYYPKPTTFPAVEY